MRFSQRLRAEFEARRARNRRYSMRTFARSIGMCHTSLSRLLAGDKPAASRTVRRIGARLGWSPQQIEACRYLENHARVARAIAQRDSRPDSRWLAVVTGLRTDEVNIALHALLASRAVRFESRARWTVDHPVP
jgi:hypothetical protein